MPAQTSTPPAEAVRPSDRNAALFPVLSPEQLECVLRYASQRDVASGDVLFAEGDLEDEFYIVLEGKLKVTKRMGGENVLLTTHGPGQFSGALTMLTGGHSIANAHAVGTTRVARVDNSAFLRLIADCPDVAQLILATMARRRPEVEAMMQQREKLFALGKMAAGLAHELNNPASAAGRAADQLSESIRNQQTLALDLCRQGLDPSQVDRLVALQESARAQSSSAPAVGSLELSDREQELGEWLQAHGVEQSWMMAGTLAAAGLDRAWIEDATKNVTPTCIPAALTWITATMSVQTLLKTVDESASRISKLVQAIKDYSHMDQAPLQEIDVHEGLESTLVILDHKFRRYNIEVVREYDKGLPKICAYPGELNQVWTNLIVNAIDAIGEGGGHITIGTHGDACGVTVEIADDGPGIPKDVQAQIFDPFFTTKEVGKGTGLGLDICYRIVVERHHGDIRVVSRPGDTRFIVSLPIAPPKEGEGSLKGS